MNIFAPQSIETQFELAEIADLKLQIISPQSSTPIIAMKQDQLLGVYNLTSENYKIDWRSAMNLLAVADIDLKEHDIPKNKEYTGKNIYSYLIPKKINLVGNTKNGMVVVKNGIVEEGILAEDSLGAKKSNSLVKLVWDEYGVEPTRHFLDNTTRLINNYNMFNGFSVGIKDLGISIELENKIQLIVDTKKLEIEHEISEIENNPDILNGELFEKIVNQKLTVIRDDVSKIFENSVDKLNNFRIMESSGSKGKMINLTQMIGLVGQQDFKQNRILKNFNERTLPYYFKNDDRADARGFIDRSFSKGLNLQQFIFHHLTAREGLIDQTVRSVTPDTRIMIIENSKPKVVEIGPWIDQFLEKALKSNSNLIERDVNNFELVKIKDTVIPTVDENGKVTWGNVVSVTRHDSGKQLYEIITKSGRKVIVPESKSLLIWNNQTKKFEQKLTPEVVIGDKVPVTMNLCEPSIINKEIDMTNYFSKNEYIYGTEFIKAKEEMNKAMGGRDKIPSGWWENNNNKNFTLPYDSKAKFQRTQVRSNNENVKNGYIYPYGATKENVLIPDKFKLNKENGQFIGLFLADGNVDFESGYIQITKNNKIVREFVEKYFDTYNIKHTEDIRNKTSGTIGTSSCIRGYSRLFCKFLDNFVGHGAHNKFIPNEAFNAPEEFIIGLVDGYISGDGYIGDNCIEASSSSFKLIEGLTMILNRLGIFAKTSIQTYDDNEKGIKHTSETHRLSIRGQWATLFKNKISLLNPDKNDKLIKMNASIMHKNYIEQEDVILDKIKEINLVDVKKYPKLYDLTIPDTYNFIISNGLGLVDTAESGYVQRKLIKSTEDFMVNYDCTVRNAVGRIQQFIYGDSGADTVKQYAYKFNMIEMSNSEMIAKYKLTKEEMKQVKNFSDKDNNDYVNLLMEMRDNLRRTQIKATLNNVTIESKYMLPININHIIVNIINDKEYKDNNVIDDPLYIFDTINRILDNQNTKLLAMTKQEMTNPNSVKYKDDKIAKTALKYALFEALCPKTCIIKHKMNKKQLEKIAVDMINNFNRSIVEPGEMVGIIAAQSLGEPVTQLMLNAFHSSGIGGKGGTNIGVDRIKEVFSLSKNPKQPYMYVYLDSKNQTKKDFANKIASHIKFTTIKDLRSSIEIFYDPMPYDKDGFMEKDNVYNIFHSYQQNKQCCLNSIEGLPWLMRIEFDKEKLLSKEVTLLDIKSQFCFTWEKRYQDIKTMKRENKQLIEKVTQLAILSNTDNDDLPVIHLRFDLQNFNHLTLVNFMNMFVDDFKLKGMPNIDDIIGDKAAEERYLSFDNEDKSLEKKSEYMIITKGINMDAIRNIIGVDLNRTYCNDIITTYEVFGIEAARNLIIREIIDVLQKNGSSTNYQHVSIFGDLMTNIGTLTSIDRFGLNKLDTDPLARASFEKTVDQLVTAAIFNEVDYMKSVSSRIMAGLCIKGGTGICNLVLDKDLLENSEYTTDSSQLYNKTYEDITVNINKQEIDTDVFVPDITF